MKNSRSIAWGRPALLASLLACLTLALASALSQNPRIASGSRAQSPESFDVVNGKAEMVTYRGRAALHLVPDHRTSDDSVLAMLKGIDFADGIIEADVAGAPRADAPPDARGFIGIAFHVQARGEKFENLYLRPTNGRANDQLRRNHSVQYTSEPDYPWERLRKENPGVYESYVDLEAGAWTHVKIVVAGATARLYINGAEQPCLIVNDLKLGQAAGPVALWAHATTDAYFSNLKVNPGKAPAP